jgi:S1-C subfamily serine protease
MGYLARDTVIITSAHVVPDDRRIYETTYLGEELPLSVKARLPARDIALLTLKWQDFQWDIQDILSVSEVKIGDTVSIPVSRSGSLVRLTGVVREVAAQVLAYDQHGEVKIFSGIILPDTPFLPWDSGAPVFNRWGKLIDVVHVR